MSYFKDAKVGDKVYCLRSGEGEIVCIYNSGVYVLGIDFDQAQSDEYTINGRYSHRDNNQSLFYLGEQPDLVLAPKKIKKYKVVYNNGIEYKTSISYYKNEEDFNTRNISVRFVQTIEDSMIEVEE